MTFVTEYPGKSDKECGVARTFSEGFFDELSCSRKTALHNQHSALSENIECRSPPGAPLMAQSLENFCERGRPFTGVKRDKLRE
jgi:hypothetical protein